MTSPLAVWETTLAVARRLALPVEDARMEVRTYLSLAGIVVMPVPPEVGEGALDAFERYGKGRHPASLNFGDCFAYACARHYGAELLFKGDDFSRTDIVRRPSDGDPEGLSPLAGAGQRPASSRGLALDPTKGLGPLGSGTYCGPCLANSDSTARSTLRRAS